MVYEQASDILEDLGILRESGLYSVPPYTMVRSEKNARAFIQGLFLASGSINSPKTANYQSGNESAFAGAGADDDQADEPLFTFRPNC